MMPMPKKRILIVDDERLVGIALIKELEDEGYEVESVTSGMEAVRKFKSVQYDLVFVDLVMPGLDGAQTCQKIKEISPATEIICFTGTYDSSLVKRQMEFLTAGGRIYFLYKPFKEGYIVKTAQKALASK
jgi:CheY-like chemotaxis protein